jgi:hypothetical protein
VDGDAPDRAVLAIYFSGPEITWIPDNIHGAWERPKQKTYCAHHGHRPHRPPAPCSGPRHRYGKQNPRDRAKKITAGVRMSWCGGWSRRGSGGDGRGAGEYPDGPTNPPGYRGWSYNVRSYNHSTATSGYITPSGYNLNYQQLPKADSPKVRNPSFFAV